MRKISRLGLRPGKDVIIMVLKLEKRGCDFWKDSKEEKLSDVGNYRVCTAERLTGKNGREYFIEFSGRDRYNYRYFNKKTGEPLKKAVRELVAPCALWVDTEYENDNGAWRDLNIEKAFFAAGPRPYTCSEILRFASDLTGNNYDKIEWTR